MAEKLIAQSLAFTGPFDDSRDIYEFDRCRDEFLRNDELTDPSQPIVRYADNSLVWLNRTKGIVRALSRFGTRECVKQRALPDIGQPNDSSFHFAATTFQKTMI